LRYGTRERARWDLGRLFDRQGRLDLSLIGVAVLFLIYYFAAMGLPPSMDYAITYQQPFVRALFAYASRDVLAWLLAAVAAGRIYLILRGRAAPLPLWDGLALGGVACFVGYLYLRLVAPWYSAPVDLIGVLYVGRFAILSLESARSWSKSIVLSLMFIVVCQNIFFFAAKLYGLKNAIHGKVEIARVIEEQYHIHAGPPLRLFFPLLPRIGLWNLLPTSAIMASWWKVAIVPMPGGPRTLCWPARLLARMDVVLSIRRPSVMPPFGPRLAIS
jgi:hypothetical protein